MMLTANLWVDMGLVNGSMGSVVAICYDNGGCPPHLPIAVMVRFDAYRGPTLSDGTVPITPLRRTWSVSGVSCSRLQLPLKLAWAVTIHKAQGLTLDKVVIDVGKKEFSTGLTFVACSRVRRLQDLLFDPPFPFQCVATLANSQRLQERLLEDTRLLLIEESTLLYHPSTTTPPFSAPSTTPSPPTPDWRTPTPPQIESCTPSPVQVDWNTSFPLPKQHPDIPSLPSGNWSTSTPPTVDYSTPSPIFM